MTDPAGPEPVAAPGRRNTPQQYVVLALLALLIVGFALRGGSLQFGDVLFFAVLVPSIVLHEVSHGAVALVFGDRTAQQAGRLTLNPIKHIDPFWTIILPAIMVFTTGRAFGMAKPVPVSPSRMRSPRNHGLLTSLAGPATNIVIAGFALLLLHSVFPGVPGVFIQHDLSPAAPLGDLAPVGAEVLYMLGLANVILAAFNLLPIPPLDGSAVPERLLPERWLASYLKIRQFSFVLFIGLFFVGGELLGPVFRPVIVLWGNLLPA